MEETYFVIKCLGNWYTEYEFCLKICIHFQFFLQHADGEREKKKRRHKNLFHPSFTPNGMKGNVPFLPHNIFSRPNIHGTFSLCSISNKMCYLKISKRGNEGKTWECISGVWNIEDTEREREKVWSKENCMFFKRKIHLSEKMWLLGNIKM